jgi:hypothetical protein
MLDRSRWFSVDVMVERDLLGEARVGSVPGRKTGRLACLGRWYKERRVEMSNAAREPCRGRDAGEGSLLGDGDLGQDGFPELLQCPHRRNERARGEFWLILAGILERRSLLGSWLRHNGIAQGSQEACLSLAWGVFVGRARWKLRWELSAVLQAKVRPRDAAKARETDLRERRGEHPGNRWF